MIRLEHRKKYFELQFDAPSFVEYMASLGFNFSYTDGVVEFNDADLLDAIIYGVGSFGRFNEEHANKNLVLLFTIYVNKGGLFDNRVREILERGRKREILGMIPHGDRMIGFN